MSTGKIILGTAQFGFDYGIRNKRGKIPEAHVFQILDYAFSHGITKLDTAAAYGESEKVIGRFIRKKNIPLEVISKLPICREDQVEKYVRNSLNTISRDYLYGFLIHDFNHFVKNTKIYEILKRCKKQGIIKKIGFSLYYPSEMQYLLDHKIDFDILQIPYNIFDRRFSQKLLAKSLPKNVEIYARSIFLQGLLLTPSTEIKGKFISISDKIRVLEQIGARMKIDTASLCLNFVLMNPKINNVVIGIDNLIHLQRNIEAISDMDKIKQVYDQLLKLREEDERVILPINW